MAVTGRAIMNDMYVQPVIMLAVTHSRPSQKFIRSLEQRLFVYQSIKPTNKAQMSAAAQYPMYARVPPATR